MNRIVSFFKGRGFYIALAACILAAAATSFWAIRTVAGRLGPGSAASEEQQQGGVQQWDLPQVETEQKVNDVPVSSPRPSQRPSSASGQPAPQEEAGGSGEAAAAPAPSFVSPVAGQTLQGFSGEELVFNETLQDWRTHNGLDIGCAADAAVKSAVAGTVKAVYEDGMWGRIVEVEAADGLVWRYAGLDGGTLKVKQGDAVSAGQELAKIGEVLAESAMGPHLHLEVLKDGAPVDPQGYF